VLRRLAHGLTNKLIHSPCVQLRQLGSQGRSEQLDWAWQFLGLRDGVLPDADQTTPTLLKDVSAARADKKT